MSHKIFGIWFSLFILFHIPEIAAENNNNITDLNTSFEVNHEIREAERRVIVASNLQLDPEESEVFWPLYDKYRNKIKDREKKGQRLLLEFAENYDSMSTKQAEEIVFGVFSLENSVQSIRLDHLTELKSIITGSKLLRYFQIDNRLDVIFKYKLTKNIPLLPSEDIDVSKSELSDYM